ncbi:MAG: hypothetical protein OXT67_04625 [Zetaproteobacteria bacterium]|nr:hypothetical protein [Zetaproteobacteria bacterium]
MMQKIFCLFALSLSTHASANMVLDCVDGKGSRLLVETTGANCTVGPQSVAGKVVDYTFSGPVVDTVSDYTAAGVGQTTLDAIDQDMGFKTEWGGCYAASEGLHFMQPAQFGCMYYMVRRFYRGDSADGTLTLFENNTPVWSFPYCVSR